MGILLSGSAAILTGGLIGGHGWLTGGLIVLISGLAALLGGMSRPAAQADILFTTYMIIGSGMGEGGLSWHPFASAAVFAAGAIWGKTAAAIGKALFHSPERSPNASPAAAVPSKDRLRRWRRSLAHFAGWQFTLRVVLCMAAAQGIGMLLHQRKSYWISLTVAIALQRNIATVLSQAIQRGIGTAAGVLLGCLLVIKPLPHSGIALLVGFLGALRPIFKNRSNVLYAMLMTPYMIVMTGLEGIVTGTLLFERLLDTIIGCAISLGIGCYLGRIGTAAQAAPCRQERTDKQPY